MLILSTLYSRVITCLSPDVDVDILQNPVNILVMSPIHSEKCQIEKHKL